MGLAGGKNFIARFIFAKTTYKSINYGFSEN
jgi:hypothetical protein